MKLTPEFKEEIEECIEQGEIARASQQAVSLDDIIERESWFDRIGDKAQEKYIMEQEKESIEESIERDDFKRASKLAASLDDPSEQESWFEIILNKHIERMTA